MFGEADMKTICISIPELALIAGTRAALGAGIALIVGDQLTKEQKKAVGWTLLLVGAVTTIPLLADVIGKRVKC
jgi:hypothetical protein